ATILTSNASVHEPSSRFGPALRLRRRSWAESAAFEALQLNPGSAPVHLGDPVQWVNQPMVHLVNRSTAVNAGQTSPQPLSSLTPNLSFLHGVTHPPLLPHTHGLALTPCRPLHHHSLALSLTFPSASTSVAADISSRRRVHLLVPAVPNSCPDHPPTLSLRVPAAFAPSAVPPTSLRRGKAEKVVVVGGGYIGMEVATATVAWKLETTTVHSFSCPEIRRTLLKEWCQNIEGYLRPGRPRLIPYAISSAPFRGFDVTTSPSAYMPPPRH
ncbi:hypothetical protein PIB30_038178, partial [Stylosanthes scabra]|nr:hypothetical protein [Stylosanthes scabra]